MKTHLQRTWTSLRRMLPIIQWPRPESVSMPLAHLRQATSSQRVQIAESGPRSQSYTSGYTGLYLGFAALLAQSDSLGMYRKKRRQPMSRERIGHLCGAAVGVTCGVEMILRSTNYRGLIGQELGVRRLCKSALNRLSRS